MVWRGGDEIMAELDAKGLKRKLKDKMGLECERHVLLCTGPNCQPDVASKSWKQLGKCFKACQLQGRAFHRTEVKCLKLCRRGPIALVFPEGTYYHGVTPSVAEQIVQEHLLEGRVVEERAFAHVPPTPPAPRLPQGAAERTEAPSGKKASSRKR